MFALFWATFNIRFSHPLPFKLAHSQALTYEYAFASVFIRLCLDDLQKTTQSIFWSFLVWSDISITAGSAGKAVHTSGIPSAVCPGAAGSHWSPSSPIAMSLRSAVSTGWVFFKTTLHGAFHARFLLDLCRPSVAPRDTRCPGRKPGWGGAKGACISSTAD